mmetsp:Transcript_13897/g.41952  ORF Transcript_13897/g.41952 Transcript_13897/m.41952 type:complete len:136 (+) Transcript_13897:298-705(+)
MALAPSGAQAPLQPDDIVALEKIKADGTYDELKKKMVALLKEDKDLLRAAEQEVQQSPAFRDAATAGKTNAQLQAILRQDRDLERALLERVITKLWHHGTAPSSELARDIDRAVHAKLCVVHEERAHKLHSPVHH